MSEQEIPKWKRHFWDADWAGTAELLEARVDGNPKDLEALAALATVRMFQRDWKRATAAVRRARRNCGLTIRELRKGSLSAGPNPNLSEDIDPVPGGWASNRVDITWQLRLLYVHERCYVEQHDGPFGPRYERRGDLLERLADQDAAFDPDIEYVHRGFDASKVDDDAAPVPADPITDEEVAAIHGTLAGWLSGSGSTWALELCHDDTPLSAMFRSLTSMAMRSDSVGPHPDQARPVVATLAMACPGDSRRALASALIGRLMSLASGLGPLDLDLNVASRLEEFIYWPVISDLHLQNTEFGALLNSYMRQLNQWAHGERIRAACGPLQILVERCNYTVSMSDLYPNGDLDKWPTEDRAFYQVKHAPEGGIPTSVRTLPSFGGQLILTGPDGQEYRSRCPDGIEVGVDVLAEAIDEFRKGWEEGIAAYKKMDREHGLLTGRPFKDLADRLRYDVEGTTQKRASGRVLTLRQKWSVTFPSVIDVHRYVQLWELRFDDGQIVKAHDSELLAEALSYAFPSFAQGWDRAICAMKKYLSATPYERSVVPAWKRGW